MNILFVEDDLELSKNAVIQLEQHGNVVRPVFDLESARAVMADPDEKIQMVISDHQLPDGLWVPFVIEMKGLYSQCLFIVVSGCLNSRDIVALDQHEIAYYHKPLLYGKIIDEYRRKHALKAPVPVVEEVVEQVEDIEELPVSAAEPKTEAPQAKLRKKWFGLFGG